MNVKPHYFISEKKSFMKHVNRKKETKNLSCEAVSSKRQNERTKESLRHLSKTKREKLSRFGKRFRN
jgi:3'-phosphoadenosine 5'-phosphosulfate (PAPS) 3'-phosphatase